jgi:invasion protein IalB
MKFQFSKIAIVVTVALAAAVFGLVDTVAQTGLSGSNVSLPPQSPQSAAPATASGAAPAAPAQQVAQIQPAPAPAVPQRTEQVVQDGWVITCVEMSGQTKKTCSAQMKIQENQQHRVILVWVIGRTAEGALTSVFQGPTGVLIQKGIDIKLANGAPRKANYVLCSQQNCEASLTMDDAMVKEATAAAGANAVATITAADGRAIEIAMPLKGIDKVLAAIRR